MAIAVVFASAGLYAAWAHHVLTEVIGIALLIVFIIFLAYTGLI